MERLQMIPIINTSDCHETNVSNFLHFVHYNHYAVKLQLTIFVYSDSCKNTTYRPAPWNSCVQAATSGACD